MEYFETMVRNKEQVVLPDLLQNIGHGSSCYNTGNDMRVPGQQMKFLSCCSRYPGSFRGSPDRSQRSIEIQEENKPAARQERSQNLSSDDTRCIEETPRTHTSSGRVSLAGR
jgi:hypothetical protein